MHWCISTGGMVAALNLFPPGAFPEHRLDYCRQQTNRAWRCSPVEEQWVGFVELGVVCNNEDNYNEHARNYTVAYHIIY